MNNDLQKQIDQNRDISFLMKDPQFVQLMDKYRGSTLLTTYAAVVTIRRTARMGYIKASFNHYPLTFGNYQRQVMTDKLVAEYNLRIDITHRLLRSSKSA
jgi:hypothetical protein